MPAAVRVVGTAVLVAALTLAAATAAVLGAGALLSPRGDRGRPAAESGAALRAGPAQDLSAGIARAQERLRRLPRDWTTWAELGMAYVQQARITANPAYYPKAEAALRRSMDVRPRGNASALVGMAALAAARHDFAEALRRAREASAIDPYQSSAYGVAGDALIELGRYDEAFTAIQRMVDLRPGTASYARASYAWELRGDLARARRALQEALDVASSPSDAGFALYYLGELAWNAGDLTTAAARYDEGLRRAPDYLPLLAGRAKVRAARGQTAAAIDDYRAVTARLPQPGYVAELGDLLAATGDRVGAEAQFALVRAEERLLAAQGVDVDLELALFEADHRAPGAADRTAPDRAAPGTAAAGGTAAGSTALSAARATYAKRRSVFAADALAWALHAAGRDAEALRYAREALRLGTRSAPLRYHLGVIESRLGQRAAAHGDLALALRINPHFSVIHAPAARAALASLGGAR